MKHSVKYIAIIVIYFIAVTSLLSCGRNSSETTDNSTTGSLTFSIEVANPKEKVSSNNESVRRALDCTATGISTIEASVFDSNNSFVKAGGPWNCDAHAGSITGVKPGANCKLTLTGKDSGGSLIYSGDKTAITITSGSTIDAGTVIITQTTSNNTTPAANAGTDQNVTTGSTVTLDGSGSSDADGDTLGYSWTLTRPTGSSAALSDSTKVNPNFETDIDGTYTVSLVVNDGTVNSAAIVFFT